MPEYGITPEGVNIKRLDVILDEIHTDLSAGLGFNTRQDPFSFLNVLITNFGDKIAELWEVGAQIYHAMSIDSAEGINLDRVAQLGGATRKLGAKSYYPIHCTGLDGTILSAGTLISSDTNPPVQLSLGVEKVISRASCNQAVVVVAGSQIDGEYSVALNGVVYRYQCMIGDKAEDVLNGLAAAIDDPEFSAMVNETNDALVISVIDPVVNYPIALSEGLTTSSVTSIITFGTTELGDFVLPNGAVTRIVQADSGLIAVENRCGYVAGRTRETDAEFRAEYASRIFKKSSRMGDSIVSAILSNVLGVTSAAFYENCGSVVDEEGRPPHSIELVVEGGNPTEIAQQILDNKSGGIQTYGSVAVDVPDAFGGVIPVYFNRPTHVYCWFSVDLYLSEDEALPPNYIDLIQEVILDKVSRLKAGENVKPQRWPGDIAKVCSGIDYLDIAVYSSTNKEDVPPDAGAYTKKAVTVTKRQKAVTDFGRIEVHLNNA